MILEIIVISVIGTLLHFTYNLSGKNRFVGLFSAVNESTWEHIKMGLTPMFLCSISDELLLGYYPNYYFGKLLQLMIFISIIPLIYYTYTKIIRKRILIIDIMIFYISIILSIITFYKILSINQISIGNSKLFLIGIFIIFGIYMIATLFPFKGFLFRDPLTGKYGYPKKENL